MADNEQQVREIRRAASLMEDKVASGIVGAAYVFTHMRQLIELALCSPPADDQVRCIRLKLNGEWGSFYLRGGLSGEGGHQVHWCELTCYTSFGLVGHYWGGMGMPAVRFLAKINSDYALGKLWGMNIDVYCESTTRDDLKPHLLREQRDLNLTNDEARERWRELAHADLSNKHAHIVFVSGDDYWSDVYAERSAHHPFQRPASEGDRLMR